MKPLAIFRNEEGGEIVRAALSIWRMKKDYGYGAGIVLRSLGFCLMLPIPIYGRYEDLMSGAIYKGWRVPVVCLAIGFVRGEKKRPKPHARAWFYPVGEQKLMATLEQIQDGMVI